MNVKQLIKKRKKIQVQIDHLIKLRLNDRTSDSWEQLRSLKKERLNLKSKIYKLKH